VALNLTPVEESMPEKVGKQVSNTKQVLALEATVDVGHPPSPTTV